jgi:uncharacterized glyoxalase superfamily protein PhnB
LVDVLALRFGNPSISPPGIQFYHYLHRASAKIDHMLKFAYTIFYVQDVVKTIEFYEKAFGFKRTFIADTAEFGQLDTGGTALSFATIELLNGEIPGGFIASDARKQPLGMEVAFSTDNVEQAYQAAIAAGATEVTLPAVKPWGQTVGYVRDINGFLVEICTPVGV